MDELEEIKALLQNEQLTCAVRTPRALYRSKERGVRPLIGWLRENPRFGEDGIAADKVIGKAAALLFVLGGVRQVYAGVLSELALAVFSAAGVRVSYGRLVPQIRNREGTGFCPMETMVAAVDSPAEAFRLLDAAIK